MKIHFRRIKRDVGMWYGEVTTTFRVACGTDAHWTRDTTSDKTKVTCKRCLAFIAKQQKP